MFDKKTANKVTLASLDEKIGTFMYTTTRQLEQITEALNGNGKPGIKTRIALIEDKLEDQEESSQGRKVNILALWSVVGSILAGITIKLIVG